jgi:hypothetical protein
MIPSETFQETISDYKMLTNNPLRYIFDKLNNDRITVSDNIYQSVLKRPYVKETDIFDVAMKERSLRVVEYIYAHSKDLGAVRGRLMVCSAENALKDSASIDFDEAEKFLCQAIIVSPDQYNLVLAFMLMGPFPAKLRISIQALTDEHCWAKMLDHLEKTCDRSVFGSHIPGLLNMLYGVAENIGYTNLLRALDERLHLSNPGTF